MLFDNHNKYVADVKSYSEVGCSDKSYIVKDMDENATCGSTYYDFHKGPFISYVTLCQMH